MTTTQAPPTRPVPVFATVREAWRTIADYPRLTLLPMLVIEVPVAFIAAVVTVVLYLTVFRHESVLAATTIVNQSNGGPLFALFAITAFELLFAQVARGAAIKGIASARSGQSPGLSALLDPAFTRMGGLIALAVVSGAVLVAGALTAYTLIGGVIALFLYIRWAVVFEALMLEDRTVMGAFARSWRLMNGNMLRYLGVLAVTIVLLAVPFVAISLLDNLIAGGRTTRVIMTGVITFAQGILLVPLLVLLIAVTTIFYFKAKERADARTSARN